ncbi:1-(5-phosphoribosyl)-5-[(5-phosphoribosylamino)methylideneamino]imidazole-4-carboxamide isomerase [bacterium]|nr:MAG: 1-(5-phosphoribosyl)-5-[(5-phosphoribosylamino)methylideneamino]imidazole-4-carboxamide isomerase [bacterium]
MLILPAIDIRAGRTVRLLHGDYAQETVYNVDPADQAVKFVADGAEWIHVVDLDGAKAGHPVNGETIGRIVRASSAKIEVGGGVRTEADVQRLLDEGVSRVVLGSVLVKDRPLAERLFGRFGERVAAGIDARDGMVATEGWLETSRVSALELAKAMRESGARVFIVTDIATDGALQGPNLEFLKEMAEGLGEGVIASGGMTGLDDVKAVSAIAGIEGAIVGRALYEGRIDLAESIMVAGLSS